jgi:transposase
LQKSRIFRPPDDICRARWIVKLSRIKLNQLVFVDESSSQGRHNKRPYGWSLKGFKCRIPPPNKINRKRYSILPALTTEGYIAYEVVEGSFKSDRFFKFLKERVLPRCNPAPGPRSVIVMDNASSHHKLFNEIKEMCGDQGVEIIFLPPYSPDLNPIKSSFSALKAWLKRNKLIGDGMMSEYERFLYMGAEESMKEGHAVNYFKDCGIVIEEP